MLESEGYKVRVAHYADAVKFVCRSFFDWDGNKNEYGRGLLQYVGTDVVRSKDENYWVRFMSDILHMFSDEWDYVIIPDARFPNEIEYMREHGFDVTHVRIVRNGFDNGLSDEQKKHPSETSLDDVKPDVTINNDGDMVDLTVAAAKWLEEYEHEEKQLL